ncbi:hypothetical protein KEM55_003066 [Ascosphaera atra]|nr:hypothetical protein KEM55_003066 [Ascosphaera atra]
MKARSESREPRSSGDESDSDDNTAPATKNAGLKSEEQIQTKQVEKPRENYEELEELPSHSRSVQQEDYSSRDAHHETKDEAVEKPTEPSEEKEEDASGRKRRRDPVSYAEPPDEDDADSIVEVQKPAATTEPSSRPQKASSIASEAAAPAPRRTGRRSRWDEDTLTTSTKSPLINLDLVKLLSHPEAWTCLTEDEKKQILSLLPENIHPEADAHAHDPNYIIPPLPNSFLRYSNPWRDAVRQFQSDLELGRYTRKWQRDAAQASRERAQGMFVRFKEEQFEEFWGQKQKLDRSLVAGESSKVKLETLVKEGVIKVGDIWKYTRLIRKEKRAKSEAVEEVFIEKECKVAAIRGVSLTFLIPPERRVFLNQPDVDISDPDREKSQSEEGSTRDSQGDIQMISPPRRSPPPPRRQGLRGRQGSAFKSPDLSELGLSDGEDDYVSRSSRVRKGTSYIPKTRVATSGDIIFENVTTPNQLGNKILELDGRIKDPPNGNAWKDYRCYRSNQDIGSLWEVRHLWFTKYYG